MCLLNCRRICLPLLPKPSAYSSSIYSVNVSNIRLGITDLILSLGLGEYLNKLHPFLPIVQHGNKSYGGF